MSELELAVRASFPLRRSVELPNGTRIELQQPPFHAVRDLFITLEEKHPGAYETPGEDAEPAQWIAHKRALNDLNRDASIGMARLCLPEDRQDIADDQLYLLGDQCETFATAVIELCGRKKKEADSESAAETEGPGDDAPFASGGPTE